MNVSIVNISFARSERSVFVLNVILTSISYRRVCEGRGNHAVDRLLHLGDLETTRNKILKDAKWIVLLCRGLHLLHALWPIALERVLGLVGIIEIQIWVGGTNALSICADSVDEVCASLLEERILASALPGDVRLVDWLHISRSSEAQRQGSLTA
jgi:hypothetical protein